MVQHYNRPTGLGILIGNIAGRESLKADSPEHPPPPSPPTSSYTDAPGNCKCLYSGYHESIYNPVEFLFLFLRIQF